MPDENVSDMELVMPFVVCTSQGGPYDDNAFVAGWALATIDAALGHGEVSWSGPVATPSLPQLELIAMKHGLSVVVSGSIEPDEHWTVVTIERPLGAPEHIENTLGELT